MTFDPRQHMGNLKGKDYLEVKWRLVWYRDVYKNGRIETEVIATDPLVVKATVYDDGGMLLATGHGSAQANTKAVWSGREIEKAETAAIGRALAHAGFGTQFTDEDEGDNIVDSPVERTTPTPPTPPKTAKKGPNSAFSKKQDATPAQPDNGAEIESNGDAPEQLFDMANMAAFQKWANDKLDVSTKDIADAMVMTFGKPLADVAPTLTKSQMIGAIIAWSCSYDVDVLEAGYAGWPDSVYEAAFGYILQHKVKNAAEIGF